MARHYYLTRSGRLRRKDNTLCFEPSAELAQQPHAPAKGLLEQLFDLNNEKSNPTDAPEANIAIDDEMGDLTFEPEAPIGNETALEQEAEALVEEEAPPVRVAERRVIPIEDVDAFWVFGELDLNARALN